MSKNRILYFAGNALIVLSLCGLIYTIYPIISIYFFSPSLPSGPISASFYLSIPKIHAYSEVVPNIEPWDEEIYNEALKKGVAHAKGSYFPGDGKTIFLFAHSSGSPWEITHRNTIFLRLGELKKNDKILVDFKGKRYIYAVFDKKEVSPRDVEYIKNTESNFLILQTCTPLGTSLRRLLIFAIPA